MFDGVYCCFVQVYENLDPGAKIWLQYWNDKADTVELVNIPTGEYDVIYESI